MVKNVKNSDTKQKGNAPRAIARIAAITSSFIVVIAAIVAIVLGWKPMVEELTTTWQEWMNPYEAPENETTVLLLELDHDITGKYTSELGHALKKGKWRYVRPHRPRDSRKRIVVSPADEVEDWVAADKIRNEYGAEAVIYGAVSADQNTVRLKVQNQVFAEPRKLELYLLGEKWPQELYDVVQNTVLNAVISEAQGVRKVSDAREDAGELNSEISRLNDLRKRSSTSQQKEEVEDAIAWLSMAKAKNEGDIGKIAEMRKQLTQEIEKLAPDARTTQDWMLVGDVGNLFIYEGLMTGNPTLIDEGLRLGNLVHTTTETHGDFALIEGEAPNYAWADLVTVLALGCGDARGVDRLIRVYQHISGCSARIMDATCPVEAGRSIWALRSAQQVLTDPKNTAARVLAMMKFLSNYHGRVGHWMDPFTHTRRLAETALMRQQTRRDDQLANSHKADGMNCPNLPHWLDLQGWVVPAE